MSRIQNNKEVQTDTTTGIRFDVYVGAWTYGQALIELRELLSASEEYFKNRETPDAAANLFARIQTVKAKLDGFQHILNNEVIKLSDSAVVAPLVGMVLSATQDLKLHGSGLIAKAGDLFIVKEVRSLEDSRASGYEIAVLQALVRNRELDEWDNCIYVGADSVDSGPEITMSKFALVDIDNEEIFSNLPTETCPFCGSNDVALQDTQDGGFYVECLSCRAEGPFTCSRVSAISAWNIRKGVR